MIRITRKRGSNKNIVIILSFTFLLLAKLIGELFSIASTVEIIIAIFPIVFVFLSTNLVIQANKLLLCILIWDFINVMYLISNFNGYYLRVIVFQNLVLFFCVFAEQTIYSLETMEKAIKIGSVIATIFAISGIVFFKFENDRYYSICAYIIFEFSYFVFCKHKNKFIIVMILSALLLFFKSRSSIIMMLAMLFFYYVMKKVKTKKQYIIIFVAVVVLVLIIPKIYMQIYASQNATFLNVLARQYTGKNLFSGRNRIWPVLDELLNRDIKTWMFGLGGSFVGGEYSNNIVIADKVVSTHNLFLFLRGQGGMFLFGLFFVIVYNIYSQFFDYLADDYVCAGSSYLLALMIRASFDLLLMANRFVDSMFSWFVISLVLGYVNYLRNSQIRHVRR